MKKDWCPFLQDLCRKTPCMLFIEKRGCVLNVKLLSIPSKSLVEGDDPILELFKSQLKRNIGILFDSTPVKPPGTLFMDCKVSALISNEGRIKLERQIFDLIDRTGDFEAPGVE